MPGYAGYFVAGVMVTASDDMPGRNINQMDFLLIYISNCYDAIVGQWGLLWTVWLEVLRPEFAAAVDCASRNHELAFTAIMDRLRSLRRYGHVCFHDLPDEQAVGSNHASVT